MLLTITASPPASHSPPRSVSPSRAGSCRAARRPGPPPRRRLAGQVERDRSGVAALVDEHAVAGRARVPVGADARAPARPAAARAGARYSDQHRVRVVALGGDVDRAASSGRAAATARAGRAEAGVRPAVPLHRRALGSRPSRCPGTRRSHGSCTRSGGDGHVAHARSRRRSRASASRAASAAASAATRACAGADAAGEPRPVVVAEHPVRPRAVRQRRLVGVDQRARSRAALPGRRDQVEVAGRSQPRRGRSRPSAARSAGRARRSARRSSADRRAHARRTTSCTSGRSVVNSGTARRTGPAPSRQAGFGGLSRSRSSLIELAQRVDAEAVDAAASQKRSTSSIAVAHRRVAPVQVGLLGQVGVVVVRARGLVPRPGRAAEHADPVVRRRRPAPSRHRYQSRRAPRASAVGTTGARPRCGSGRSRGSPAARARAPRRPARRSPRACRTTGRRRCGRRRRSRSRPSARGRTATARPRRPRATRGRSSRARMPAQVADAVAVGVLEGARVDLVDRRPAATTLMTEWCRAGQSPPSTRRR